MTVANELIAQLKVYKEEKKKSRRILNEEKKPHTTELFAKKLEGRLRSV